MKSIKELRIERANRIKHLVIIRLTPIQEDKLVKLLEERNISLSYYVTELINREK